jgi:hypothetical protein
VHVRPACRRVAEVCWGSGTGRACRSGANPAWPALDRRGTLVQCDMSLVALATLEILCGILGLIWPRQQAMKPLKQ